MALAALWEEGRPGPNNTSNSSSPSTTTTTTVTIRSFSTSANKNTAEDVDAAAARSAKVQQRKLVLETLLDAAAATTAHNVTINMVDLMNKRDPDGETALYQAIIHKMVDQVGHGIIVKIKKISMLF
jgi:hypothetical protein